MTNIETCQENQRRFSIPGVAELAEGKGGLPMIRVTTPEASAEIYLHGAHLTSWKPAHTGEVLFLSEQSGWQAGRAIRGGVPVCFPWFREKLDNPKAPSHGFARLRPWRLDAITQTDADVHVSLSLENDQATAQWFPHAFRVEHRLTIGRELLLELVTHNTGDVPFHLEDAQHTYYRVGDATQAKVQGLDGVTFYDNTAGGAERQQQGALGFARQVDNAYQHTEHPLTIVDPVQHRRIHVTKQGSSSTVCWNPWADGAAKLADLGDEAWREFVCVEAANMRVGALEVAAGARHALVTRVAVETL